MLYVIDMYGSLIRVDAAGRTSIPADPANVDYQAYLLWQAAGGVALPEETREQVIARVGRQIAIRRDQEAKAEFEVDGEWYQAADANAIEVLGMGLAIALVAMGKLPPQVLARIESAEWTTVAGDRVAITEELILKLFVAHIMHKADVYDAAKQHVEALAQASDPAAYDYSGGWPPRYTPA